jgi:TATA-box binding protein (TBP) (component of TFIID and TFIIIB)
MEKTEYEVVNVVVSSYLPSKVDLMELAWKDSSHVEYSRKFPAAIYRLKNPKSSAPGR